MERIVTRRVVTIAARALSTSASPASAVTASSSSSSSSTTSPSSSSSSSSTPRRKNKRTAPSLSPLISLYHSTESFLPLTSTELGPHLLQSFAPPTRGQGHHIHTPSRLSDLLHAQEALDLSSLRASISLTSTAVALDQSLYKDEYINNFGTDDNHKEGWSKGWSLKDTDGAERPLRSRLRRVGEALHGTEAGGRAGLKTVLEGREEAREVKTKYDSEEGLRAEAKERVMAEKKKRQEEEEKDAWDFAKGFHEEEQRVKGFF